MEPVQQTRKKLVQNIEAYQAERNRFLEKQYQFKFGDVKYGVGAAALMRSMYVELIYSSHSSSDAAEAAGFLATLEALYARAAELQNDEQLEKPAMAVGTKEGKAKFMPVVALLDATYLQLKTFEKKCGFE